MTRARRRIAVAAISALLSVAATGAVSAAPPWLEGLSNYRIVDASGRIAYRPDADASGRIVYRPTSAPSIFLRARPFYPAGYAGARYGPNTQSMPVTPTGYWACMGRKPCGHVGPCFHRH